jgi:hypothetical protein
MSLRQMFARKSLKVLLADMESDNRLKRALGPVTLTALGIGAVIGAGIFVATGEAARNTAGPALMVSYMVAGLACIFAALCYAEFASMAPVAGSAYTYAYTTMGELFAWIIGWDLVLEYAVGASTVANGWSGYFVCQPARGHYRRDRHRDPGQGHQRVGRIQRPDGVHQGRRGAICRPRRRFLRQSGQLDRERCGWPRRFRSLRLGRVQLFRNRAVDDR